MSRRWSLPVSDPKKEMAASYFPII